MFETNEKKVTTEKKIEMLQTNHLSKSEIDSFLKILLKNKLNICNDDKTKINEHFFSDLEMFPSGDDNDAGTDTSVFSKINNTSTQYGEHILIQMLQNPITNIDILTKRKQLLKQFLIGYTYKYISNELAEIQNTEKDILYFWKDENKQTKTLMNMVYFGKYLNLLNSSEIILNITNIYIIYISPLSTTMIPILSFLIPIILFKLFKINIPLSTFFMIAKNLFFNRGIFKMFGNGVKITTLFTMLMWVVLYLSNMYTTVMCSLNTNKIINILHNKLNKVALFVRQCDKLQKYLAINKINIGCENIGSLQKIFNHDTFYNQPTFISNKGKILQTYLTFLENKNKLVELMEFVGKIDCYSSICKLYLHHNYDGSKNNYSFASYCTGKSVPSINSYKSWHPYLDASVAVANNMSLGKVKSKRKKTYNMLLTGPNASGKSTFVKSISLMLLFAQTITICPASYLQFTPFYLLNTYLHINDVKGVRSSFEMEMYRCKKYIDEIKSMKSDQFSFVVMDEVLTSTNYKEGIAGAYAICKNISEFKNNIAVITTHYTNLTKLYKSRLNSKKCRFTYYKFDGTIDKNTNEINYTHLLKRGISHNNMALNILQNNNFDKQIIDDAFDVVNCVQLPEIINKK